MPKTCKAPLLLPLWLGVCLLAGSAAQAIDPPEAMPLFLVDSPFGDPGTTVHSVNPDTGELTLVAALGSDYSPILGLAAANASLLYVTATDNSDADACQGFRACLLLRIGLDPASPTPLELSVVGPVHTAEGPLAEIAGLTFRGDGRLYAVSQITNALYTVEPATALATLVGPLTLQQHGGDITFDGNGRLWDWSNLGDAAGLYEIDPETGAASAFELHPFLELAGMAAVGHGSRLSGASPVTDTLLRIEIPLGLTGDEVPLNLAGGPFDHSRGDLDSPYCAGDASCGDANPCTRDLCLPGGCHHEPIADCCVEDTDCRDDDTCTVAERCENLVCLSTPLDPEDGDRDGVPDCRDACPRTTPGVPVDANGCFALPDCPCEGPGRPWRSHGEYVSCVAHALRSLPAGRRGSSGRSSRLVSEAARDSCGKVD